MQEPTPRIDTTHLKPGSMIGYHLPASDLPKNPHKVWRGRVIQWQNDTLLVVELLEPGYSGLSEFVDIRQIVGVEHK